MATAWEDTMDRDMAMAMAMEMGMDWAALEAEAETTGTPAMCAVCMEACMRAMETGGEMPATCPDCPLEDGDGPDGSTPTPETLERALEGARICLAHWLAEGDAELARDAQGRLERLQMAARGETPGWWTTCPEARSADVDGALDWLDTSPRPDMEAVAIAGLVAAWDAMVAEGETTEAEMAMGLVDQLGQATQGWSAGMETDMEAHPELAALVGLAEGMDDEEWDEAWERWEAVEQEAARQWLGQHPEAWMAADPETAEQVADMLGAEEAPTSGEQTGTGPVADLVAGIAESMPRLVWRDLDAKNEGWDPYKDPERGRVWQEAVRRLSEAAGVDDIFDVDDIDDAWVDLYDALCEATWDLLLDDDSRL